MSEIKDFDKEKYRKQLIGLRKKENTIETKKKLTEEEVWRLLDADIEKKYSGKKTKKTNSSYLRSITADQRENLNFNI